MILCRLCTCNLDSGGLPPHWTGARRHFRPSPLPFNTQKKRRARMSNKSLADLHLLRFNNWKHQTRRVFCSQVAAALDTSKGRLLMKKSPACRSTDSTNVMVKTALGKNCPQSFQPYFFGEETSQKNIRFHKNEPPRFVDALGTPTLWPVQQPTSLYSMRVLARTFNMLAIRGSRNFSAKASTFFSGCLERREVKSKRPRLLCEMSEKLLSVAKKAGILQQKSTKTLVTHPSDYRRAI